MNKTFFILAGCLTFPAFAADAADKNAPLVVEEAAGAKIVATPTVTKDVNLTLDLGFDVAGDAPMKFSDALVALSNIEDLVVVVEPEVSDPELGNTPLHLAAGRVPLRDFISQVCQQVGATWSVNENQAVVLSKQTPIVVENGGEGGNKTKIDVDFAGVPLSQVAASIAQQTGVTINVNDNIKQLPIEISIVGWDVDRIIKYLADMYELNSSLNADTHTYTLSQTVGGANENDDDEE
ncbi:hypothetical protein AGMMS49959_11720 [Planctomycetales bacterium]|nr:hypothetical protein AGMMS49959_11720 [Planctomycetales bacterium]